MDPKPAQRFLFDNGVKPMDEVRLVGNKMMVVEEYEGDKWIYPPLKIASLSVDCRNSLGKEGSRREIQSVEIST